MPRQATEISRELFPALTPTDGASVVEALTLALGAATAGRGEPLLPLRAHIMFRNVQGLWACSDDACTVAAQPKFFVSRRISPLHPFAVLRMRLASA